MQPRRADDIRFGREPSIGLVTVVTLRDELAFTLSGD
jgi:hypothetical protein